jgi:CPA2 family monovalent cation:H+ antiporter-2
LPALSGQAAGGGTELLTMAGKGVAFIVWVLVLARWIVPLVMRIAAREYAREVFVIVAAGLCLGGAATGHLLGFSVALGAFAAGLVISESEYSHQFLADVTPLRDLFAMIFFVSLGLLWDVRAVLAQPYLALWLLLAVVVGKPLVVAAAAWAGGYRGRSTIGAGLGLAQIGEFSFLVVTIAWRQDLLTEQAHSLIIAVAGVSLLTTPALMRLSDVMCARIGTRRYASEALAREERAAAEAMEAELSGHVLICGYGRVGRVIGETLLKQGRSIVVVDYDQHVALELRSRDVRVIYGDASSPVILRAAGADRAGAGVVALPDSQSTRTAVRELRAINPDLPIIARVHLSEEVEATYAEGATEVVYAEFEAGLEMIRHALVTLGHDLGQAQALADGVRRGRYRTLARGEDDEGAL